MDWRQSGRVAVITGGASGIGFAAAQHFARQGMHVLLADRDAEALSAAQDRLAFSEARVEVQTCDVSDLEQVVALRDRAFADFGAVHCLMNNAGAGFSMGDPWTDLDKARKTLEINLWGVLHGCHAFIPAMLDGGEPGVVVNTGSKQGITRPPGNYGYNLSKAGVLAYTESVAHALRNREGCAISAHLLIPGFVYTGMVARYFEQKPPFAWTAEQTVDFLIERLAHGDFYILCPDNETPRSLDELRIQWTADDLIQNRPALSRWHPDYAKAFAEFVGNAD